MILVMVDGVLEDGDNGLYFGFIELVMADKRAKGYWNQRMREAVLLV